MENLCIVNCISNSEKDNSIIQARFDLFKVLPKDEALDNNRVSKIKTVTFGVNDVKVSNSAFCLYGLTQEILSLSTVVGSKEKIYDDISKMLIWCMDRSVYICGWDIFGFKHQQVIECLRNSFIKFGRKVEEFDTYIKCLNLKSLSEELLESDTTDVNESIALFLALNENKEDYKNLWLDSRFGKDYFNTITEVNLKILIYLMDIGKFNLMLDVETFLQVPRTILKLNFGKYSGCLISELNKLDNKYLRWLYGNKDIMSTNKNLQYTLTELFSIK